MHDATACPSRPGTATRGCTRNTILLGLVLCQLALALTISSIAHASFNDSTVTMLLLLATTLVPLFMIVLMVAHFLHLAILRRPKRPLRTCIHDIRTVVLDPRRLGAGLASLLLVAVFSSAFTDAKANIAQIQPFAWDPWLAGIDRGLHFGHDPWVLLQPVFGSPLATTFLNANYHFWLFLMYFMIFMASFDRHERARSARFIFALLLSFALGGNILAILLSSAGPVYFQAFGFGTDFAPLMQGLRASDQVSPVWALDVQRALLKGFHDETEIRGISAMPSMHVASSAIMTLYAFSWRPWAGWLMVLFSALIMFGSVHLGWHYAVDAYIALPLAVLCWWLAERLCRLLADPA